MQVLKGNLEVIYMVNQHASFFGGPRHAVSRKAGAHKRAAHDGAHLSNIVFTKTAVRLQA
jgi:hypothetical protein